MERKHIQPRVATARALVALAGFLITGAWATVSFVMTAGAQPTQVDRVEPRIACGVGLAPPDLTAPSLGEQFAVGMDVVHSWLSVPNVAHYLLDFASGPSGCQFDAPREITGTDQSYSHDDPHQPIYWRVRAVTTCGDTSSASVGYYFYGSDGGASCDRLSPPVLVSPAPGDSFAQNEGVLHAWIGLPDAVHYLVDFATAGAAFENCLWGTPNVVSDTMVTYPHQDVHEPLYFRVRAVLASGDTTNPSVGYYTVGQGTNPVATPRNLTPWGSQEARNTQIGHNWDPVVGAASYQIQFANGQPHPLDNFGDCVWQNPGAFPTAPPWDTNHQSQHCPVYWRVRAVDGSGQPGNWALSYYFVGTTAESSGTVTFCFGEDDLAVPVINDSLWGGTVIAWSGETAVHTWDPVSGADEYEVQALETTRQLNPFDPTDWSAPLFTSSTSITLQADQIPEEQIPEDSLEASRVYVRVRAKRVSPSTILHNSESMVQVAIGGWGVSYYGLDRLSSTPDGSEVDRTPSRSLFELRVNVPNPFNPSTRIHFDLAQDADVSLAIYDVTGRFVQRLVHGRVSAGPHSVPWDGRDERGNSMGSGLYYCRLSVNGQIATRPIALVR